MKIIGIVFREVEGEPVAKINYDDGDSFDLVLSISNGKQLEKFKQFILKNRTFAWLLGTSQGMEITEKFKGDPE